MTVLAGIAEFERDLIRERTGGGREAAKQRGVRFGQPRKLNTDEAQVAVQLLAEGKTVRDIARTFKVHEAHDLSLGCCFVTLVSDKLAYYAHTAADSLSLAHVNWRVWSAGRIGCW